MKQLILLIISGLLCIGTASCGGKKQGGNGSESGTETTEEGVTESSESEEHPIFGKMLAIADKDMDAGKTAKELMADLEPVLAEEIGKEIPVQGEAFGFKCSKAKIIKCEKIFKHDVVFKVEFIPDEGSDVNKVVEKVDPKPMPSFWKLRGYGRRIIGAQTQTDAGPIDRVSVGPDNDNGGLYGTFSVLFDFDKEFHYKPEWKDFRYIKIYEQTI